MPECKYPECGKEISRGLYCTDQCARYHNAMLHIGKANPDYTINEIAEENRSKWN